MGGFVPEQGSTCSSADMSASRAARSIPVNSCTCGFAIRAEKKAEVKVDWGLLCFSHVHAKYCAKMNTKKNIYLASYVFFLSFPGCFLVPLICLALLQGLFFGTWEGGGRNPC